MLRKHVSGVKGGRLAESAYPARQSTIYISDVPDDVPSMVVPRNHARRIHRRAGVRDRRKAQFGSSLSGKHPKVFFDHRELPETPKPGDRRFANSRYFCLLSSTADAVAAAIEAAGKLGFAAEIDLGLWDADYQRVVHSNVAALDVLAEKCKGQPACLVVGGEVTCPVTGPGMGGRNQAFALTPRNRLPGAAAWC